MAVEDDGGVETGAYSSAIVDVHKMAFIGGVGSERDVSRAFIEAVEEYNARNGGLLIARVDLPEEES